MTRLDLFKNLPAGSQVCEVGVYYGQFMEEIMTACPTLHYVGVDNWAGKFEKARGEAYRRAGQFRNCSLIAEDSWEAATDWLSGQRFDLVYIDGNHRLASVMRDLEAWRHRVYKGGILAGHDFETKEETPEWEPIQVEQAVTEWSKSNGLKLNIINETCPSWWVQL